MSGVARVNAGGAAQGTLSLLDQVIIKSSAATPCIS
jgi:hypothetical protein